MKHWREKGQKLWTLAAFWMLTSLMTFLLLLLGMLGVPLTHVLVCGVFSCALRVWKRDFLLVIP